MHEKWQKWFLEHKKSVLTDFFHFLKFKSIATDPLFEKDTKACADWLLSYLQGMGIKTTLLSASGMPVVFAEYIVNPKAPTLLLYHHYDVQPVDPLELWESDPFQPVLKDGKVYARGAQDNKGQCFYSITAVKAWLELCQTFQFNIKLFIEGEEEGGSRSTLQVIEKHRDLLKSDYLLVVDSGIPGKDIPAITLGARGILTLEMQIKTANLDMHSGSLGGVAYNPIRALVKSLASLWDEEGKVAIRGFYDAVVPLTKEERKELSIELDEKKMKQEFGLKAFSPEPGYTIGESATIRPTVEINGISGGYAGMGFKTVLPAVANAKISCRLVPNQDPQHIFACLKHHLEMHVGKGIEVKMKLESGFAAFRSKQDSFLAKVVANAYEDVLPGKCQKILCGGSIPITGKLAEISGADTLLMGYGLDTDQIHAPNEHFGLDRFELGFLTMGRIFSRLNEIN